MCGIAVLFEYRNQQPADKACLLRMREHMHNRGPDGAGLWCDQEAGVGLAHRRLAIIDLSDQGAQPMQDATGRYVVSFNGEIYNYRALRAELQSRGRVFRTRSDTEVLINTVAEYGPTEGLTRLRGMFAFALWDREERSLLLARDPYGIKPLYYADDGNRLIAASQVKALLASGRVNDRPDPAGHVGFHLWGSVPEPFTLFQGIRSLPAGHFLRVTTDARLAQPQAFATVDGILRSAAHEKGGEDVDVQRAVKDSVRHHLESDVPVGLFLSSGIDSCALAGLISETGTRLKTVTLAFDEFRGTEADEAPLAESVARHYGSEHETVRISQRDFDAHLNTILDNMDQPSIDGVNSYFVSWAAKQTGLKVALSGLGGDELFGGYPSFRQIPRLVRAVSALPAGRYIGRPLRNLMRHLPRGRLSPKTPGLIEYGGTYPGAYLLRRGLFMPWELDRQLDPDMIREGIERLHVGGQIEDLTREIRSPYGRIVVMESSLYMRNQLLRDVDWASMAHSLEVRTPLVDATLLDTLSPSLVGTAPVRKAALARTPVQPLPDEILHRPKTGFTVPVQTWAREAETGIHAPTGYRGWARRVHRRYMASLPGSGVPSSKEYG